MASHAKNGSDGAIREGQHMINQAEAVALMGAQVCLHLTLTCVCTVDRATLLQQCRGLSSRFESSPGITSK